MSRFKPISVSYTMMDTKKHTDEGRVITLEFELFYLVAVYVPCSSDDERSTYRRDSWEPDMLLHINYLREKKSVILTGDLNVAHNNIDVYNPISCAKRAGFLPWERALFDQILDHGWIDVYRQVNPTVTNKFSWYGYMINPDKRRRNGLRLDYFLCDIGLLDMVRGCDVLNEVVGSDHCPVHLVLEVPVKETEISEKTDPVVEAMITIQENKDATKQPETMAEKTIEIDTANHPENHLS